MKIKYKYRSPLFYVLFYGGIVLMILLAYSGVRLREEDAGIILISIAVYIVSPHTAIKQRNIDKSNQI